MLLGAEKFILKLIGFVAFARVFYHCHYFGDTIIGTLIGYVVAATFHTFDLSLPIYDIKF